MKLNETLYKFIGLAARAGAVCAGSAACENGIRHKKVYLVLLDKGASQNTVKDFTNMCKYYKIELLRLDNENMLGNCIGKAGIRVAGITDKNLAQEILNKANQFRGENN